MLVLSTIPATSVAQVEVVGAFHGYEWGTTVDSISEIAGTEPVGEKQGLIIHSAQVEFLGRPALAGFYFHPESAELLEGAYVIALREVECESEWARFTAALSYEFPSLDRTDDLPTRDDPVYDSDCEYFLFNDHLLTWRTEFRNTDPPGDMVFMWLRSVTRIPRVTVVYSGARARAWLANRAGAGRRDR